MSSSSSSSMAALKAAASRPLLAIALTTVIVNCWLIYLAFVPLRRPWAERLHGLLSDLGTSYVSAGSSASKAIGVEFPSVAAQMNETITSAMDSGTSSPGFCDLSRGRWVPDSRPPFYTNETCKYMNLNENCVQNGRQDLGFLNWRWWPDGCELPYFDPPLFLEMMRGKRMGFIGDSLARNHMQSLLCSLAQVEEPVEVPEEVKAQRELWWRFPVHNFTLAAFWSPFLVKTLVDHQQGRETFILHLDAPEEIWLSRLHTLDLIILSAGSWYYRSGVYYYNNTLLGATPYSGLNVTKFDIQSAVRISYSSVLKYLVENYKGVMMLRTITMSHFENGTWHDGGYCNRTVPYANSSMELPSWGSQMNRIQVEEFDKATKNLSPDVGSRFSLLNITRSAYLRSDGHPDVYRPGQAQPGQRLQRDCLHWCLPGPIDMWNQLVLYTLRSKPASIWRS